MEEAKDKRQYTNENQQNMARVTMYLAQDILTPKTMKEIMEALNLSRDVTFRTIWNLKDVGWVEEGAYGYRLSPRLTLIADRLRQAVADTLKKYLVPVKDSMQVSGWAAAQARAEAEMLAKHMEGKAR
ncbi:MAG: hypothetical protein HS130_07770 [Deltaproteobacteria bacterium]|nr:hypothetical protein [Deltaproteobacteria bacterium]MCL4873092.1 hypothetical protein [bacterium]